MGNKKCLHTIGNIFQVAKVEYLNWITNSKMLLLVFLFVYAKEQVTDSLLELVKLTGNSLQVFEPGIAFLGSRKMMMVLPLLYFVLMGDFPRNDGNKAFFMMRIGKKVWLLGQLLFAIASGVTTIAACVISVTLPCIGKMTWNGGNWSEAVTKDYLCEDIMDFKFELITEREYNHMMPDMAFIHSLILMTLFLLLISVVQLMFSICGKKVFGFAIMGSVVTIGNALAIFENHRAMWYFPIANTQIWLRHDEIFNTERVTLVFSYGYFMIWIIVAGILSWRLLKKGNVITGEKS